ncbi:hypothetical protein L7F22_037092 [Adiantum nelumboides]|nr:hypothetical protein [Adiantum nelumboides]
MSFAVSESCYKQLTSASNLRAVPLLKQLYRRSSSSFSCQPKTSPRHSASTFGKATTSTRRLATMATMSQGVEQAMKKADDGLYGLRHTVWDQQDIKPHIAYNLVKEGKKVIVLEGKAIGSGMTGRTTAHLMAWNDDFYYMVADRHGEEVAKLVGESHRAAIDFVERTVQDENIDCKFSRVNGYLFPHEDSEEVMGMLNKEFEAAKRVGFDVKMVDLKKDPACGKISNAILFPNNADFHPLMYIQGLAKAITNRGGKIYEQCRVSKNEGHKVTTEDGVTVTAHAVVLATHSPLNHNLAIHSRQEAQRSYVLGFKLKKGSVKKAQWWDTNSPYHYIRIEEKDDFDVLVVGGNDHPTGIKGKDYLDPYSSLEKWARERWTEAGEVLYKWTGQVYKPIDTLHLVGPDPKPSLGENVYVATGDSGQGMTGGTIAGILLKDLILKRENPWARMYSPARLPSPDLSTAQAGTGIVEQTVKGYASNAPLVGTDTIDIEDLMPTTGAIKQEGLQKVAVYKDENGQLHKYSAVCPHLKCIVQWNPVDKSFDCPCHGSIFDSYGRCVNGPAKADLSPLPPDN